MNKCIKPEKHFSGFILAMPWLMNLWTLYYDNKEVFLISMGTSDHLDVKQNRFYGLDGLKAIVMLSIFLWHSTLAGFHIDIGARACELLFVISGFLVGYNHYYKDVPATWNESFRYSLNKISRFWHLHFFATLIMCIKPPFSAATLYKCMISLCMLQAWSNNEEIYFACNGVMWYMSALMFCCFMSPLLLKLIRKGIRFSLIAFIVVFLVRLSIDYLKVLSLNGLIVINTHVSPVIRCMEYLMGMLMVPLFITVKKNIAERLSGCRRMITLTLIETALLGGIISTMLVKPELWRSIWVLFFCPVVFVFALNEGLFSRVLSIKPFQWFSKIQMEFYILHQVLIIMFSYMSFVGFNNAWINCAVILIFVLIFATAYHVLVADRLTRLMRGFFSRLADAM